MVRKWLRVWSCLILTLSIVGCSTGSEDGSKSAKTTIVVSTFTDDGWIAQAKRKYEDLHPDIEIQIKPYMSADGVMTTDDVNKFIMVMNTELLSGKGPDILDTSMASAENWINKKLLANLSDLMKADSTFDQSQLFGQILEGMKVNGKLFEMPMNFILTSMLVGDEDAIKASGIQIDDQHWNWDDFAEIGEKLMEDKKYKSALGGYPPEQFLIRQIRSDYRRWVDTVNKQARFETDAFTELLKQTKALYERKVLSSDSTEGDNPETYFYPASISSFQSYLSLSSIYSSSKLYLTPSSEETGIGVSFLTTEALAMNEKSSVKQEAWEFIKFVVSEEMQFSPAYEPEYSSFMINKNAYRKWIKAIQDKGMIELMDGTTVKVTEQDLQELDQLIARANKLIIDDHKVLTIVAEEAKAYFVGQKSADEVAKMIQNRVMTYLNE